MNARNRDIARIVLDLAGKGCLLDTSKPPERMIRLVHTPGLDVRVVHMVRDPRGWCNSRKKAGQADVRLTAQEWVKRNAYMARLVESLPPHRWMRVRYEGLCEAPAETFNAIYALGDLPPAPLPEDMSQLRTHLLGNTMRLRGDRTIRLDTAWREKLTAEEIAAIETVTAPLARRFGYEF